MQNEVHSIIETNIGWDTLSWESDQQFFKNKPYQQIRVEAREAVHDLAQKRSVIIKNSLYKTRLKNAISRSDENRLISEFVENRRSCWTYVPPGVTDTQFNITN